MTNFDDFVFKPTLLLNGLKHVIDLHVLRSNIIIMKEEIDHISWADSLLKSIRMPKIIVGKGNSADFNGCYILFPEFRTSYAGRFRSKNHVESKFILIWNKPTEQDSISAVFEELWQDRRQNVAAVIEQQYEQNLLFYSYFPYTEGKCGAAGQPVLINTWNNKTGLFASHSNLFMRRRLNFNGCSLNVIVNNQPPDSLVRYVARIKKWVASGVSSEILKIAEEYFNFTAVIFPSKLDININHTWYYSSEELDYICDAVNSEKAAFAFGWFSYASIEMDNLDSRVELGRVSSIDCFGWAVPYHAGAKPPNSAYYTREFKPNTWCLILTVLIVTCTVFYLIFHCNFLSSSLLVLQTLLEQPVVINSSFFHLVSFRILFAIVCFYSLVVTAAYRASFASFITISFPGREFKTVTDILESSLKIYGSPEMLKVLKITSAETELGTKILNNFNLLSPCDYELVMKRVIRQRDIAVLGVKRSLYFYSLSEAKRIKVKIPFRLIPGCLIRPHTTHFLFRRGAYVIQPFNIFLNRLFESGIVSYWILHLGSNKIMPAERFKKRQLSLQFLKEPFYFLLTGYALSVLVFSVEIIFSEKRKSLSVKF